jgi:predicted metalloendopeptidase
MKRTIKHNRNNKINRNNRNKTKKQKTKDNNVALICKNYTKTYSTFEDKVEELFKKRGVDILSSTTNMQKLTIRELKKAINLSNITPENDYYSYINDRWIKDITPEKEKKYITQVDDFRLVQDKVNRELVEILEKYIKENKNKKAECIRMVSKSLDYYYYNDHSNEQFKQSSKNTLGFIDDLRKDKSNLWKLLAFYNKNELLAVWCPFSWSINPDGKNPKIYNCYLEPPSLTLVDINVYIDNGKDVSYKNKYRQKYFHFLSELFEFTFGKNHGFNIKDVYECELKLLIAMNCNIIKTKDDDSYNLVTNKQAIEMFNFDWESFTKEMGFKDVPKEFITSNINYLLCCTKMLLQDWDNEKWRTFWIYIYIKQNVHFSKSGKFITHDFVSNFMNGRSALLEPKVLFIYPIAFLFNSFLSNEYILKYNNPSSIDYVKAMTSDLKIVFTRIIRRNNWLQPETKKVALKKLDKFVINVGSELTNDLDPLLDYTCDDIWHNLTIFTEWRHKTAIDLYGKPVIKMSIMDWTQYPPKFITGQSYLVNAYYTPVSNSIDIPLAYIQKPFVDLDERGIEYNLARVGFTVCHEMSHALDDWGSQYDASGRLKDWWTPKDKRIYKKIQENIIKQYEYFALRDGIKFDAKPTIGEDLADISGLAICLEYLRDFQLIHEDVLPIQQLSFDAFFIYFAVQQRQKISKKALAAQLKTNPHPLDKYRTNVPLSRMDIFRATYNVKKQDKMWWPSTNKIWED